MTHWPDLEAALQGRLRGSGHAASWPHPLPHALPTYEEGSDSNTKRPFQCFHVERLQARVLVDGGLLGHLDNNNMVSMHHVVLCI